ncbi:MAG: YbaB/EbfC family nucleoid-associated protein [Rhodobacteraceae bacterium]|nr:YbaB/EbfC family nucleoid-associated protein [Paracoccaceae bacterium]
MFKEKFNFAKIAEIARKSKEVRKEMDIANKEIEQMVIASSSECGAVSVTCNGRGKIGSIELNLEALSSESPQYVNSLITKTVTQAQNHAAIIAEERMKKITETLGLPSSQALNF